MKPVVLSKQAAKALQKMPANQAALIRNKLEKLAASPQDLAANIKKLTGRPEYRLRVGDWRVIFNDEGEVLAILAIRPRGSAYE